MSFSGKKYKRTAHDNMEEVIKATHSESFVDSFRFLQKGAPTFCFTKIGDNCFNYVLEAEGRHISFDFTLGEEKELERRDGETIRVTFTMPSENILNQVIKFRDGKVVNFSRHFNDNEAKTIVTMEGMDKHATIYFETID